MCDGVQCCTHLLVRASGSRQETKVTTGTVQTAHPDISARCRVPALQSHVSRWDVAVAATRANSGPNGGFPDPAGSRRRTDILPDCVGSISIQPRVLASQLLIGGRCCAALINIVLNSVQIGARDDRWPRDKTVSRSLFLGTPASPSKSQARRWGRPGLFDSSALVFAFIPSTCIKDTIPR